LAIVREERIPWDDQPESESISDVDSDSSRGSENNDFQDETELKQLSGSIKSSVTRLFRLSMAIRDPAPNSQSRSFITVDKSHFEVYDVSHVQAKFLNAPDYLIKRLGQAVSRRRQYLTYREEHHHKMTKDSEKIGYEGPRTEHSTSSTEATSMPAAVTTIPDVMVDGEDTLSQTSYATSVNDTLRVPPLPKEAREKEFYECPLCYMLVSIHTPATWR
jgi:hypothetical protein